MFFNVVAYSVTDLQNYAQVEFAHEVIKSQIRQLMVHKHMYHVTFAKTSFSRLFSFCLQYLCTTNSM